MLSNTHPRTIANGPEQPGTGLHYCDQNIRQQVSFDEFSFPPYFFDKQFLDHGNVLEPYVKERMQIE